MDSFAGKIAVITGGASGVGRCLAEQLSAQGAHIVLADIDAGKLDDVAHEIRTKSGGEVLPVRVDVTKEDSVNQLADVSFSTFGAVNLLFNNAGVGLGEAQKKLWTLPMNDWRWGVDVNVLGVVHGIKAFVQPMLDSSQEGVIINTSSTNGGLRSLPNTPIYAATKAAVTSISEVLYQQLLRENANVRAAILFPGPHTVNTSIMASRLVRPADYSGSEPEAPVAYRTMEELVRTTGLQLKLTEPEEVASFALEGLKAGRFWLIPESEDNDMLIRRRTDEIIDRRDPANAW